VASDRTEHYSLTDLFGDDTELVNIAKETSGGSIQQRVEQWSVKSDRHVYIGRGSPWGNPFSHLPDTAAEWLVSTREEAIEKYRQYILSRPDLLERLKELKGKRLGCWCKPKSCHGEILLELLWSV
jgi:hypothetical protein